MDNVNVLNDILTIKNTDGSSTFIPQEGCTGDEQKLFDEFKQMYPNGKPKTQEKPPKSKPSMEERVTALEDAITMLMGV